MAQAIKAQAAVTAQRGRRVTAVSMLVSRSDQCTSIMKTVTMPICKHFARGENRVALRMAAEHSAQHSRGDGEIRRAKKNPGDANGDVSAETEQELDRQMLVQFGSPTRRSLAARSRDKNREANPKRQMSRPRRAKVRRGTSRSRD